MLIKYFYLRNSIILVFSLLTTLGFSQNDNHLKESLKYKSLKDSIYKYITIDTTKSISFLNSFIKKAKLESNKLKEWEGQEALFNLYQYNSNFNFDKLKETSSLLIDLAKKYKLKDKEITSYLLYTQTISQLGYSEEVLEKLTLAKQVAEEIENKTLLEVVLFRISIFQYLSGDTKKSLKYLKKLLAKLKEKDQNENKPQYNWNINSKKVKSLITHQYINLKNLDSIKFYNGLRKIEISKDTTNYHDRKYFLLNEAEISLLEEKPLQAEEKVNSAFNLEVDKDMPHVLFEKSYYYGRIAFAKQDYRQAIKHLENALELYYEDSPYMINLYPNYYKILAFASLKIANENKAEKYFQKHLLLISNNNNFKNSLKSKFKDIEIKQYNNKLQLAKTKNREHLFLIIIGSVLFFIVIIGFLFHNKKIKNQNKKRFNVLAEKYKNAEESIEKPNKTIKRKTKIKDSKVLAILKDLKLLEQKKFYLSTDCSLSTTAKKINTNTSYLSKVINSNYGKTFNTYVNELRIDYVIIRINEDKFFMRYTIQSIANEIGFKSKESFNKAFRKQTGILPSYYIKQLKKSESTIN